jgi:hypothetical protein
MGNTVVMPWEVEASDEFKEWYESLDEEERAKAVSQLLWPDIRSRGVVFLGRKPRKRLSLRSTPIAKPL